MCKKIAFRIIFKYYKILTLIIDKEYLKMKKTVLDNEIEIVLKKNRIFNKTSKQKKNINNLLLIEEDIFNKIIKYIESIVDSKLIVYIINNLSDIKDNHLITYVDDTQCIIVNDILIYQRLFEHYSRLFNSIVKFLPLKE